MAMRIILLSCLLLTWSVYLVGSTVPSVVDESTVAVKNMLIPKCFAYPVQVFAFPDGTVNDGLTSATFENCDGELPIGSEVTDIPYGIGSSGQVLSMPVEKRCGRKYGQENLRTGAFRVTATVDGDSEEIIVIVNPDSDLKPAGPPTYTISTGENADLEVDYAYPNEIVWAVDGRIVHKWKGQLKINVDQGGIYQAFSRKLGQDIRITYRVIKRVCPDNMYGPPECTTSCPSCTGACHDLDGSCICGPGTTGADCDSTPDPGSGFGNENSLLCEKNGLAYPGCKGILFCRRDPYGCSCMFNYGGIDCTRKCELPDVYGFNCERQQGV